MTHFGTDGVRGPWPLAPLTPALARALGRAVREVFGEGPVVLGRDTRESGPAVAAALLEGLGGEVLSLGVVPTAGVSAAAPALGAVAGVVVTASHNPWTDNGLKVLGADGRKLTTGVEAALEAALVEALARPAQARVARLRAIDGGALYVRALLAALGPLDLGGREIAVDAAHGAAWRVAGRALEALGARPRLLGVGPDGRNINEGVGALHPEALAKAAEGAVAGIALDGDADRCVLADGRGRLIDGDGLLLLLARGPGLVGTVMCNGALEGALSRRGIALARAPVGDRHVAEAMERLGWPVGGEPSGHVLLSDGLPTGDGLLTGLRALAGGLDLAGRLEGWSPHPSRQGAVRLRARRPLEEVEGLLDLQARAEAEGCRVLLRYSGTEPKLRVLVEAPEHALAARWAEALIGHAARALGEG